METTIRTEGLSVWYGAKKALDSVSLSIARKEVTALIGPSGCGKTSFLKCLNRMIDIVPNSRVSGKVFIEGKDISGTDIIELRRKVGMVFQRPNPFPKSIWENVAYGPRIHGSKDRKELDAVVERSLRQAALWEEVLDELDKPAFELSGGQQQRLCIARALAVEPSILLMDEPCSALDPIATAKIEELIIDLRQDYTVVIVTHNIQQAARISGRMGYFYMGRMIEYGDTETMLETPREDLTRQFLMGKFG